MISSTCLVPFHGVSRLAYCNYHILPPWPHTPGLDTRWIHTPYITCDLASVHIYKHRCNQERNDEDWNDDEFSSPTHLHPALSFFCNTPKKTFGLFLTNTHDERYTNRRFTGRTDERRNDNRYPILQRLGNHHDLRHAYAV